MLSSAAALLCALVTPSSAIKMVSQHSLRALFSNARFSLARFSLALSFPLRAQPARVPAWRRIATSMSCASSFLSRAGLACVAPSCLHAKTLYP